MGIKASEKRKKYELIAARKLNITAEELFRNLPKEYSLMYAHVRSLNFDEMPDYNYLRAQIRSIFVKHHYQYDYIYDWYHVAKRMKKILEQDQLRS